MKRCVLAVALLATLGGAAYADDAAKPAEQPCLVDGKPADPAVLAAATDLQVITGAQERMEQVIDIIMPPMVDMIRKSEPAASEDAITAFSSEFRKEMKAGIPTILSETACIVAHHYSLAEMQELKAFYASPLGAKTLKEGPAITKEMFTLGQAWGLAAGRSAAQRAVETLRAKGMKI
jgi:hypothetical protein